MMYTIENRRGNCTFCRIVEGELPSHKVYENNRILAIMDIMPLNEGHVLVMPKDHYQTVFDLDEDLAGEIMKVAWNVANTIDEILEPDGLNILQNNRGAAGQLVPHYHVHLIPRNHNDDIGLGQWKARKADSEKLEIIADQLRRIV